MVIVTKENGSYSYHSVSHVAGGDSTISMTLSCEHQIKKLGFEALLKKKVGRLVGR